MEDGEDSLGWTRSAHTHRDAKLITLLFSDPISSENTDLKKEDDGEEKGTSRDEKDCGLSHPATA